MPVNHGTLQTVERQVTNAYLKGLTSFSDPIWSLIAQEVSMKTKTVEAPIMGMLGPLREWVGPRVLETLEAHGYTITAKKFEKTAHIEREAIDDDTHGVWMPQFQDLGLQAAAWPDQQCCLKLETGESSNCYDGLPFFSASHPTNNIQTTFSNLAGSGSAAWYLFDTTKAIKPMFWGLRDAPEFTNFWDLKDPNVFWLDKYVSGVRARGVADWGFPQFAYKVKGALDATNFESAQVAMMSLTNAKGENLGVKPNLAIIPTVHKQAAQRLWDRERLASGEDNINKGAIKYLIGQRLSNVA